MDCLNHEKNGHENLCPINYNNFEKLGINMRENYKKHQDSEKKYHNFKKFHDDVTCSS